MRVAFFSAQPYDKKYFDKFNLSHEFNYHNTGLNEGSANLAEKAQAVCVFVNDDLNAACISRLAELGIRYIVLRCAGFNNVDIAACKKHHLKVARVPAYSPHAVAEHTMALLLTLNRKIHKAYNRVREGNFSLHGLEGSTLFNKTVGIIGLGKIGSVFAKICLGFGCKVQAYDPAGISLEHVTNVTFEQLIETSDIISLHCPLIDKTYHLIDKEQLVSMKRNAVIINTGRGALINSSALIEALKKQEISAVGLDVYEQESGLFFNDLSETIITDDTLMRLMTFPNVLITSHQGFFTKESLNEIARVTLENLNQFETRGNCDSEIE